MCGLLQLLRTGRYLLSGHLLLLLLFVLLWHDMFLAFSQSYLTRLDTILLTAPGIRLRMTT